MLQEKNFKITSGGLGVFGASILPSFYEEQLGNRSSSLPETQTRGSHSLTRVPRGSVRRLTSNAAPSRPTLHRNGQTKEITGFVALWWIRCCEHRQESVRCERGERGGGGKAVAHFLGLSPFGFAGGGLAAGFAPGLAAAAFAAGFASMPEPSGGEDSCASFFSGGCKGPHWVLHLSSPKSPEKHQKMRKIGGCVVFFIVFRIWAPQPM